MSKTFASYTPRTEWGRFMWFAKRASAKQARQAARHDLSLRLQEHHEDLALEAAAINKELEELYADMSCWEDEWTREALAWLSAFNKNDIPDQELSPQVIRELDLMLGYY